MAEQTGDGRAQEGDGRARRWAGQREKRRHAVVNAALVAVAEHGPATTAEHIAASAGVPRPQLYRYFTDADDLHDAVAVRVAELLTEAVSSLLTVPVGSPADLITEAVDALTGWLEDNPNLYRYVLGRSRTDDTGSVVGEVRTTIGRRLSGLLAVYAELLGVDTRWVDPCAFALVGMVESAATRWLDEPGALSHAELVTQLARWSWGLIDDVLRASGVVVDPDEPLPIPPGVGRP